MKFVGEQPQTVSYTVFSNRNNTVLHTISRAIAHNLISERFLMPLRGNCIQSTCALVRHAQTRVLVQHARFTLRELD
jgi:hypothetical protein